MSAETWPIINSIATVLEAVAVTITLIYVIRQTTATSKSILEMQRETHLEKIERRKSLTREINQLLMQDNTLSKLLGYKKSDILAFMLLHDCELQYNLWKNRLMSDSEWQSEKNVTAKVMSYPFVKKVWEHGWKEYPQEFAEFANSLITKPPS